MDRIRSDDRSKLQGNSAWRVSFVAAFLIFSLATANSAQAVTLDWVTVGNPGNIADTTGFGAVADTYRITKHEVTNDQYAEFLNAVDATGVNPDLGGTDAFLYNSEMDTDARGGIVFNAANPNSSKYEVKSSRGNQPVVFVSFFDAMRFVNWLHNGKLMDGSGTETGAYTVVDGETESRSAVAKFFIPSENEWYKAAYHKNDGTTGNYWDYATQSDIEPYSDEPPGGDAPTASNTANFYRHDGLGNGYDDGYAVTGSRFFSNPLNYLTDVGAYTEAVSAYGTFDQGGNAGEWTERIIPPFPLMETHRGVNGSSWNNATGFSADTFNASHPSNQGRDYGFRVASFVPEPSTFTLSILGLLWLGMIGRRRRRR